MSWIKHLRTVSISALSMAWGIMTGYETAIRNRIQIPPDTNADAVRAAVFIGGLMASIIVCLIFKAIFETLKMVFRESQQFMRKKKK